MYIDGFIYTELENYPNYFISWEANKLYRLVGEEILECTQTPNSIQDPYPIVTVRTVNGTSKKESMHRLLMLTYVPNPYNKLHVNHIDGDKTNNHYGNLEWATPQENAQHAVAMGLKTFDSLYKEVHQYCCITGDYIASYAADAIADKVTGVAKQNISKVTLGLRPQAGGYIWTRHKLDRVNPITGKDLSIALRLSKRFK